MSPLCNFLRNEPRISDSEISCIPRDSDIDTLSSHAIISTIVTKINIATTIRRSQLYNTQLYRLPDKRRPSPQALSRTQLVLTLR